MSTTDDFLSMATALSNVERELGERFGGLPQPTVSSMVHRRRCQDVS
jgi:hypothetical protein